MFTARAVCGVTHVTVAALFCSSSLLCISNSDWATENEAGWSVSVNGNDEPHWWDLSPIQFSCNCNYSLITHNKTPVHSTWGLLGVCAACPTPVLTWVPSSVPLRTSKIRSPPAPRRIQHTNLTLERSWFVSRSWCRGKNIRQLVVRTFPFWVMKRITDRSSRILSYSTTSWNLCTCIYLAALFTEGGCEVRSKGVCLQTASHG